MLVLQLRNDRSAELTLGPAPWFRISSNGISKGPEGTLVAPLAGNSWICNGQRYQTAHIRHRAHVQFEDRLGNAGKTIGPHAKFDLINNVLLADGEPLAKLTSLWHVYQTETEWPVVLFKSAES